MAPTYVDWIRTRITNTRCTVPTGTLARTGRCWGVGESSGVSTSLLAAAGNTAVATPFTD